MTIIAVDDERLVLENLVIQLKKVIGQVDIHAFSQPEQALAYLSDHGADIAFLDIEMGEINGISLAKSCKDLCPNINIIFVTAYPQYTMDAWNIRASGYLLKPVEAESLRAEIENLRHPLALSLTQRVQILTFGNFEIFVDRKPLHFPMAKCKECLAYLVDRKGACVSAAELAAVLWEDRPYDKTVQNNTHKVLSDLMKMVKKADISEIIIKTRRDIAIDPAKVDCDYYRFIQGDTTQINRFHGEYMSNYSWAEFTLAGLESDIESVV